ncbi:MAG: glycine-rich protein, partial [Candidatus Cybelea sp.]
MRILTIGNTLSVVGAAALFAGCRGSQLPAATSPSGAKPFAFTHHVTFRYTGKKQTFKVPSGVTRIQVIAVGASGVGEVIARGGRVSAVIPVTQSETLAIYVGGTGTSPGGGFNGGGAGGHSYGRAGFGGDGGGGASDVRQGGNVPADRVIVAGGGGGQGG